MRCLNVLYIGLCCLLLVNCNTTPTKPEPMLGLSPSQIKQIQNVDELVAMRTKLAAGLQGKPETDYGEDFAALAQIDSQVIELKKAELATLFASKRLESGVVAQAELSAAAQNLTANPLLPADKWQRVLAAVQLESDKTRAYAGSLQDKAAAASDPTEKLSIYDELALVTGDSAWEGKRDALVKSLVAEVRQASETESFDDETRKKISIIKEILKDDAALTDEMTGVDAKIYQKTFFDQLGEGKTDDAYLTLVQMSEAKDFAALKEKLAPTSESMADLFTAKADESVKDPSNLEQSYRWYSQALKVRDILGLQRAPGTVFTALSDQLYGKYETLNSSNEHAAALAHLYAIRSFYPSRPGLRKELVEQEKVVTNLAVKRLSTTDFQSAYQDQDYGDLISSFITQYLFEHVPHDVRIVEREQYEAILRERQLSGDASALSSVNLLVSGSVLESKVDSTESKNKKMMRVEVGKETIPNPNYISWLELSSKDRKTVEKPAETIDVAKHENISVGVTHHRKVGIFSVSYRLVEASSGRVILPDSITVSEEFTDESSEGVEMGDFVIPFKVAKLPSDVEILDTLAREVSTEIGKKLVEELKDQEKKYIQQAASFASQNDCAGQVAKLGSALMIMNLKNIDSASVAPEFETQAISCFN